MFQLLAKPYSAPDLTFKIDSHESLRFSDLKGSWIVLYFYPKDLTPGCTTEAIEFQALEKDFKENEIKVIGVSRDSCESHQKFKEKHKLNFSLISDQSSEICNSFKVIKEKSLFGKTFLGINRTTFLIDPKGQVIGKWEKVQVKGHARDVFNQIKKLQSSN
jgi:peroxiredoxin Q/BCP